MTNENGERMNFEIDIDRIKMDAAESFRKDVERRILEQVAEKTQELFASKSLMDYRKATGRDTPDLGAASMMISKFIDEHILGDTFQEKIKAIVDKNLDAAIERATLDALDHKCRKEAFAKVK